jgi:hypothetical protein
MGGENEIGGHAIRKEGMKADKGQFDEVLRRMLKKPPQKTAEIHGKKKAQTPKPKPSQK